MITLIHPSRCRPRKAYETFCRWFVEASGQIEIEHILSLDKSDLLKSEYLELFRDSRILINENRSLVEATNIAAGQSKGNIIIYLSDDFQGPHNWDLLITEIMTHDKPMMIKVDDCLQDFNERLLTIPIMNRLLYERLGYFFHPEFFSVFCDNDLFEVCDVNGFIYNAPHLKFPHNHWINKKAVKDETYGHGEKNWQQGQQVFNKHKSEGFRI